MSAAAARPAPDERLAPLRIGELAALTGTTPRTVRYYEEIGLLETGGERPHGKHRHYTTADVERVRDIIRLRDLLGLSLEQLSTLLAAETARAHLRRELRQTEAPAQRRRILLELREHIATQQELVAQRLTELTDLAAELATKQELVAQRLREIGGP